MDIRTNHLTTKIERMEQLKEGTNTRTEMLIERTEGMERLVEKRAEDEG